KEMVLQGEDDIYCFLTEGIESMHTLGEVFISEKLKRIQVISKVKVQVGVSLSSNLLQLNISNDYFSKSELAEILSKYEKKKKYYRLKSGEFIRMDEEGMQALYDLKENFQLTDKEWNADTITVPGYRALYLDQRLKGEGVQVQKNKEFKQLIRNMKTIEDNDFEIPLELEAVLREYQKTGFLWMKTLCKNQFGGILADDMGLGKTLQTITFLLSEFQEAGEEPRKAIIITPASLVYNWKNEFEKFAPQLNVHTVTGTLKERRALMDTLENQAILITSYQLLYRDEELYEKMSFDYQIIDEAQFIKNQGNQTTKAVKDIQARFRLALTGTPVENKLSELWSIFDYVMPGFLYKYQRFRKEIETPIVKNQNQEIMQRLQKMIQPFVLRRTKKEVLKELPDKIEKCMYAVLEGEQKSLYQAHAQRLQMQLSKQTDEEFQSSQIQILAELTRLRQLCCDPGTFYENYKGGSAKLDLCMQLVENAMESGHKILLFSQFTTMLDKIAQELDKRGIAHYMLTGRTKKLERVEMAEAFNQDDTPIFCISLKAGGTGLNLTGADMVIHFDPWWTAAVETQATDRAHRIGQKQVVTVYKLIASNTLEERIMELQNKKKELASQVLGGEGISRAKFSKEELLSLLE
ncbi:MAG: DEAD/DEAH box helicase, partial [Ruminococcus sp.]|nr:DEAD/DEAH box helicase [Ruminococcus sp.]